MAISSRASATSLLQRLRADRPLAAVELRPPRLGLSRAETMEVWEAFEEAIENMNDTAYVTREAEVESAVNDTGEVDLEVGGVEEGLTELGEASETLCRA